MDKDDGPDTIQTEDGATRWAATQLDDVFHPAVRVTLAWRDVETAVERGAVVPALAHALWAGWASLGSPQRLAVPAPIGVVEVKPAAAPPAVSRVAAAVPQGPSLTVLVGVALAAALAGGLLSYLVFVR